MNKSSTSFAAAAVAVSTLLAAASGFAQAAVQQAPDNQAYVYARGEDSLVPNPLAVKSRAGKADYTVGLYSAGRGEQGLIENKAAVQGQSSPKPLFRAGTGEQGLIELGSKSGAMVSALVR
jgi:hypothetical protein